MSSGKGGEESFFGAFIINTLMRGVGFLIRFFTILIGAFCLLVTMLLSFLAALLWLIFPVAIFFLFFAGVGYVTRAIL